MPADETKRTKRSGPAQSAAAASQLPIRLNRHIAASGYCSRRKADELIVEGRVTVNGSIVRELGTKVTPSDRVVVNGRILDTADAVHILLNKPRDTISTVSDDRGRRTVIDLIKRDDLRTGLFPVGRLDRHTTGLLLLTNDGDLANRLMHPKWEIEKIYLVDTASDLQEVDIERLRKGIELDDGLARADQAGFPDPKNRKRLALQIHEGRNRQIRRMIEALGHRVEKLERIRYAGLTLEGVKRGKWRRLTTGEVHRLRKLVRL